MTRVVMLIGPNGRKRTYPVPLGTALQDEYTIGGHTYTVTAVFTVQQPARVTP
jgi:hypothetical protein